MKHLQELKFKVLTNRPNGHDLFKGDVVTFPEGIHYEIAVTKNMTHVYRVKASDLQLIVEGGEDEGKQSQGSESETVSDTGTEKGSGETKTDSEKETTVAETEKSGVDDGSGAGAATTEAKSN